MVKYFWHINDIETIAYNIKKVRPKEIWCVQFLGTPGTSVAGDIYGISKDPDDSEEEEESEGSEDEGANEFKSCKNDFDYFK